PEQLPVAVGISLIQTLDQHLHRTADLLTESVRDLFVVFERAFQQRFQSLFRWTETASNAPQRLESLEGDRLLEPKTGVPRGIARRSSHWCVDEHPPFAVGDHSQSNGVSSTKRRHSLKERRGPSVVLLYLF